MTFEQFSRLFLRREADVPPRLLLQQMALEEIAADEEEDVGAVRLLRLQAAMKERRGPGSER
ncbi:MAG TPA: hypothetical protein VNM24_00675 [Burkholderiales bacterium]|jgi:hypothetical protein|nr:hypothetical protein [Burkholderiales bacterium]